MLIVAILLTIISALLWIGVIALVFYGVRQLIRQDNERGANVTSSARAGAQ